MHDGDEITTIEGLGAAASTLHPMQAAFVEHDGFQCGYCTPGQICSAVALLDEVRPASPSHVTADLAPADADRRRDPRAHERQHLPLRRLFQHRRGDRSATASARRHAHEAVHLRARRRRRPTRAAPSRAQPGAKFIAGGTNLLDLMKLRVETPRAPGRHQPPAARHDRADRRTAACASARWCATPTSPTDPRVRRDYPLLSQALLAGASPQLRNMATTGGNLLQRTRCHYFYDTGHALQQARARHRLRGASAASTASTRSSAPATHCIATHPSRHGVALARARRAVVHVRGPDGERARSRSPTSTACPATRRSVDTSAAGRADHRGRPAAAAVRARTRIYLKVRDRARYAFALVSVAAALEIGRRRIRDRAHRARRRRAQAVARAGGRAGAARPGAGRRAACAGGAAAALAGAQPLQRQRASRSSWRSARSCVRCSRRARRARRRSDEA